MACREIAQVSHPARRRGSDASAPTSRAVRGSVGAVAAAVLLALSPILVFIGDRSAWLVPILLVPAVAAYRGTSTSLERSRQVRRLEEALEQEQERSRVKDDFVAVVAHELRTPLTSIQGYVKTLLRLEHELSEEQRRSFLEASDRQSDRLRRMIDQLLAVARLESHVEPLTLSICSLSEVTEQVVDELRTSAQGRSFDLRFPARLPLVHSDEARVHRVLSNLIGNALKYSPEGTRVSIRAEERDRGVLLHVEDEGRGIPPEARDRIFDRFYQVDSSDTLSVSGTGLGLYICRQTTDALGGELWLERTGPGGTVFAFWLPERPGHVPSNGRHHERASELAR